MAITFTDKKILILGAGVTGLAVARSIARRGAQISLADDLVSQVAGFSVAPTNSYSAANFDALVVSPGWKSDHHLIIEAESSGVELLNEVDLAWQLRAELVPSQRWIALTGTNGKTTTVEMAAAMLREGGISAIACGNVGTTVIESVESAENYEVLVLELSSFQLHWMREATFVAASILNIAQDHVDWHGGFSQYAEAKLAILDRASTGIFNGDDPEACVRVAHLAFEYRQEFNKDVVIDMVCYRRRGHNEGDEPSFTQPLMYKLIDEKRTTRTLYTEALVGRGDITPVEAEEIARDYQAQLEEVFASVANYQEEHDPNFVPPIVPNAEDVPTFISEQLIREIAATQVAVPEGFHVHPKLLPQLQRRAESINDGTIDWSTGEMLAFGSLLKEGRPIRLAGQDSRRGTFSNRHAVIIDKENGSEWTPLRSLISDANQFFVVDSLLSEYAAMGFEYGYSVVRDEALVLWEGQFGDFANGAQTIIDEFISSALQKWGERSSVVLLLPHGYEGQGPDHSSARIERFLALCAEKNMTVAQPSTPASYFHLLRFHAANPKRRPMVVFTPKSMLRLKAAASSISDFTSGTFLPVIGDSTVNNASRLIFCSGKVYHDLVAERTRLNDSSTAIVRVERLYPLPVAQMEVEAKKHPNANLLWVQDEPANQGAWPHVALSTTEVIGGTAVDSRVLRRISRRASASPATGNHHLHEDEAKALLVEAFTR